MPKIKRAPDTDSLPATLDVAFTGMTSDAVSRWRAWATAMADGQKRPAEMREILDVANALGIRDPGSALAKDAEAIANVRHFEQRSELARQGDLAKLAEHGGPKGIADKISQLNRQIEELRRIASCPGSWNAVEFAKATRRIRQENPRAFDSEYRGEVSR